MNPTYFILKLPFSKQWEAIFLSFRQRLSPHAFCVSETKQKSACTVSYLTAFMNNFNFMILVLLLYVAIAILIFTLLIKSERKPLRQRQHKTIPLEISTVNKTNRKSRKILYSKREEKIIIWKAYNESPHGFHFSNPDQTKWRCECIHAQLLLHLFCSIHFPLRAIIACSHQHIIPLVEAYAGALNFHQSHCKKAPVFFRLSPINKMNNSQLASYNPQQQRKEKRQKKIARKTSAFHNNNCRCVLNLHLN